jgi:phosphate transport system substrate-binding protein
VVVRADSSGTSFVFSKHLSAVSEEFAKNPGTNKMPSWPVGTKSKGNEGVTASIKTTPGSIGYIEYGYAKSQNMPMAILENKSGNFVAASVASGQTALATTKLDQNLIGWNADPDPADAYPIATYTWMLFYKTYPARQAEVVKDLLNYAVTEGQKDAEPLGYIPLPPQVVEQVKSAMQTIQAGPSV